MEMVVLLMLGISCSVVLTLLRPEGLTGLAIFLIGMIAIFGSVTMWLSIKPEDSDN